MNNVVKFKKPFQFRIGIIIFFVLSIYLVVLIVSFLLHKNVPVYEVTTGELSSYYSCKALAIRKELVIESSASGYLTYFAKEDTKVGAKSLVYALDTTGNIYNNIKNQSNKIEGDLFSQEKKESLLSIMDEYSYGYSDETFYTVNDFKESINLKIIESIADEDGGAKFFKGMSAYYAFQPGIVLYEQDGLEEVTINTFTYDDVYGINYSKENLKQREYINSGDSVYKLITDENWFLVSIIDDNIKEQLKDKNYLNVTLKSDNYKCEVPFTIVHQEDHDYLILEFSTGVIRYAQQRYLDVELEISQTSGYKVPISALVDVDFYKIPKDCIVESGNSNGVLLVTKDKDGKEQVNFEKTALYRSDEEYYYIHESAIKAGSVIQRPQSSERYEVHETKTFPCVYCVNKGYAVIRMLDIVNSNEDYVIIRMDTSYGINNYDHIVLDATTVEEEELIY